MLHRKKKKKGRASLEWNEGQAGRGCGLLVVSPYCSNVCVTVTLLGTAGCRAGKYGWAEGEETAERRASHQTSAGRPRSASPLSDVRLPQTLVFMWIT